MATIKLHYTHTCGAVDHINVAFPDDTGQRDQLITRINASLHEREWFLPEDVGLEPLNADPATWDFNDPYAGEDDDGQTGLHTLMLQDYNLKPTDEPAQLTLEELTTRFEQAQAAGWPAHAANLAAWGAY